ncbi:hypothetical protein PG991_011790, partial [Apiospora marii]
PLPPPYAATLDITRSRSPARKNEPLGLHVLHAPAEEQTVDVIFVHGLGGSSQLSWSWKRDLSYFWPKEWLSQEPDLQKARILTFGYNASFMSPTSDLFNISAFAKELLLQLKFGGGASETPGLGKVPIIFVVHSMGGLVVKKALILGYNDSQFKEILDAVRSVVFLATPHRGSGLAEILNRFLQVSFHAPKKYVGDLQRNSPGIEDINEQFRHHASRLQIVSFFETMPSSLGLTKTIVVEKDSAVLGYSEEISAPLDADHHTVCKFASPQDPNYITVRNVIRSMVQKFQVNRPRVPHKLSMSSLSHSSMRSALESSLGVHDPNAELSVLLDQYIDGSCDWILNEPGYQQWKTSDHRGPVVLQITGHAGSGKSVLASFLIHHLQQSESSVQYFFFRFDADPINKSIRQCLLSLAYQMATQNTSYGQRLRSLLHDRHSVAKADVRRLWQKAFIGLLGKSFGDDPIYWVIDAVDESDSAQLFLNLLPSLNEHQVPLRVILLTRPHTAARHFERLRVNLSDRFISASMATPKACLSLFIQDELNFTKWPGDPDFVGYITRSLLEKCRGNFLWLRLVLQSLAKCDYQHEATHALDETPDELADVYRRIQNNLSADMSPENRQLALRMLSWITSSERQLTLEEISEALQTSGQSQPMLHLEQSLIRLCGDLVTVDKLGVVSMVHHSAKEFLVRNKDIALHIDTSEAHTLLLMRCLNVLTDAKFRLRVKTEGCAGFIQYCCTYWSHHLAASDERFGLHLSSITAFLTSTNILSWIDAVCQMGQLRVLTTTAKNLNSFRDTKRKADADKAPTAQGAEEMEIVSAWANELIRVVGKFGHHLLQHPSAIYTLVPSFCPQESVMGQQFGSNSKANLSVTGLRNTSWDDCLASFSVGHECQPTMICCAESYFAIHTQDDTISLLFSSTFQVFRTYRHEEVIVASNFDQDYNTMVTCGSRTVKLWDIGTGSLIQVCSNPLEGRAVAVALSRDSTQITTVTASGQLRSRSVGVEEDWKPITKEIPVDGSLGSGEGTPCVVSFSPDGIKVAIAYRGRALGLWNAETGKLIGRCHRQGESTLGAGGFRPYPQRLTWNPVHEHIIGLYNDSKLFKWNPVDSHSEELESSVKALEVACSPDGRFIVTASPDGSLRVWQYDTLGLMYHLSCSSPVTDIAISSDGRRIYDLRDSFCNVWEPSSLIRLALADDRASETSSSRAASLSYSTNSEFVAAILEPITALEAASKTSAYCYSSDDGTLCLRLSPDTEPITVDCGYIGATRLAFDHGEARIACAEIEGTVSVWQMVAHNGPQLSKLTQYKSQNPVQQILFDHTDSKVIIRCTEWVTVFSIASTQAEAVRSLRDGPCHLVLQDDEENTLLAVYESKIVALRLSDLSPINSWHLKPYTAEVQGVAPAFSRRPSESHVISPQGVSLVVDSVFKCPNMAMFLVQTSHISEPSGRQIGFFMVNISKLAKDTGVTDIDTVPLPITVLHRIEIPLGWVTEGEVMGTRRVHHDQHSLAFLDQDFWVCSWSLGDVNGSRIRKHFFLPRDWINMESLELSTITTGGTFFCPRNGDVAVVTGGLRESWVD